MPIFAAPQSFCAAVKTLQELEAVVAGAGGGSGLPACSAAAQQHLHEASYSHDEVGCRAEWRICCVSYKRLENIA